MDRTRRTLNIALDHARRAVELDEKNEDIAEVIETYGHSVSLLLCIIESIRREQVQSGDRSYRAEDVMRLLAIHDSYRNRMAVLSEFYGIPLPADTKARL
ncbi:hypothetical protein CVT25_013045 [Psilocybe cyanescens]|uniref:Uncharacterized protein n=1 Tax=Psilocybe cyanescens TaxID=93625 RepID=A0A409X0T7_PSICY|nr:hypothetical protein CVT25_013045 [Psilocybe cyanescens]